MALLTAARLGTLTQTALRLEPDVAAEREAREMNLGASLPDFDQLHLDVFDALKEFLFSQLQYSMSSLP